jgi:hypothetical protein
MALHYDYEVKEYRESATRYYNELRAEYNLTKEETNQLIEFDMKRYETGKRMIGSDDAYMLVQFVLSQRGAQGG